MTSDELEFSTAHQPGVLARYCAERWLEKPSPKGEQLIAWLLEAALGRNALYFIERTKEYVDKWGGGGEIVPENAFNGFVITGDPVEDTIIPHAVLVWTCMNDRPWLEEVYHRWLDSLLAAGSAEAAYLAASLWPAHDLMAKVIYRPPGWRVYQGQLDEEAERLILTEMLKGYYGPRTSLYGPFEYDNIQNINISKLSIFYIERYGFIHPICGLVNPIELEHDSDLRNRIQEALAAPSWSEGMKGAAMLLYLSLKTFDPDNEILDKLEKNLFKLDERQVNIINFHMDKTEEINYNLIKDYINYLIVLYGEPRYNINILIKMFSKYISIGLKSKDLLYTGTLIRYIIFKLMQQEREKIESWLKKQADDLRIKDILLSIYISGSNYKIIEKNLKTKNIEKKMEDIYGKIKHINKIILLINQARIYFNKCYNLYKICDFICDILKREEKINFTDNFKRDYKEIILGWHPNLKNVLEGFVRPFSKLNHFGVFLYYEILMEWRWAYFDYYIKNEKELNLYNRLKGEIIRNFYKKERDGIYKKIDLYLNKIEINNLPDKEMIIEIINMTKEGDGRILEHFKDESKIKILRKGILSNIESLGDEFRSSKLIELLGIYNKSQNMIIY